MGTWTLDDQGRRTRARLLAGPISAGILVLTLAACGGSASPDSGGATGASVEPAASAATSAAAGGGSTGAAVQPGGDLCALLGPGDFAAAGIDGAGTPKGNPADNADYCVYAGLSAGAGGIELDVFLFPSAAEGLASYGGDAFGALDAAGAAAAGADKAGYLPDQLGNTAGQTFDQLRALKGRMWIVLSVPNATAEQLEPLAKLVFERGAALT